MIIRPPPKLTSRQGLIKFMEIDLWGWLKELSIGVLKINFQDNFQSFTVQNLVLPAGTEVVIPNQFSQSYSGLVPTGRLITRQKGDAVIVDGDLAWSKDFVSLKNPSANDATVSVIFFT